MLIHRVEGALVVLAFLRVFENNISGTQIDEAKQLVTRAKEVFIR
jgi:hypothetical protein